MNGLGGDDTIAAKPGLVGVFGVLAASRSGNDRIEVEQAAADSAAGGDGTDSAIVDRADIVSGVESIDQPPAALGREHRRQGAARVPGPHADRGLLREVPGGRRVRRRRAAPDHGEGDPHRRHQAPRRAGQPQVQRRPGETDRVSVRLPPKASTLAKRASCRCVPWPPPGRAARSPRPRATRRWSSRAASGRGARGDISAVAVTTVCARHRHAAERGVRLAFPTWI